MGVSYTIDDDLVILRLAGDFPLEEANAAVLEATEDERYEAGMAFVVDAREATANPLAAEISRGADFLGDFRDRILGRYAVAVSSEVHYGLARMFAAYASDYGLEVQVFRSMDEALAWARRASRG